MNQRYQRFHSISQSNNHKDWILQERKAFTNFCIQVPSLICGSKWISSRATGKSKWQCWFLPAWSESTTTLCNYIATYISWLQNSVVCVRVCVCVYVYMCVCTFDSTIIYYSTRCYNRHGIFPAFEERTLPCTNWLLCTYIYIHSTPHCSIDFN